MWARPGTKPLPFEIEIAGLLVDYLVIANLFLLLFLGLADNQAIAALLPNLVQSFKVTVSQAGLLVVVYSIAAALAAFVSGALSDHYGRRWFLRAGVVLFAVASWYSSRAASFDGLMLARFVTGLAAGTLSTCAVAYAGDWFPYAVRGRAIGLISAAYFIAPIVGVPAAATIAQRYGWRQAFFGFAILAAVVACISLTLPAEKLDPQPSSEKFRATIHAFQSFLSRRDTAAALGIAFLVSGGLVGFITFIGQWLSTRFAVSTATIGLVFAFSGAMAVASAPLGGILSDRWSKRAASIAGSVVMGVAVAFVPFLSWGSTLLVVFGLTSLGAAFRQGPLTALMTEMVPGAQRGTFIALRNISSQLGIGLTVFVAGLLYQMRGYGAVTTLSAAMTALVAILLATHIVEPRPVVERLKNS
jgi:predicted MFS family arabinose efflux permease